MINLDSSDEDNKCPMCLDAHLGFEKEKSTDYLIGDDASASNDHHLSKTAIAKNLWRSIHPVSPDHTKCKCRTHKN